MARKKNAVPVPELVPSIPEAPAPAPVPRTIVPFRGQFLSLRQDQAGNAAFLLALLNVQDPRIDQVLFACGVQFRVSDDTGRFYSVWPAVEPGAPLLGMQAQPAPAPAEAPAPPAEGVEG